MAYATEAAHKSRTASVKRKLGLPRQRIHLQNRGARFRSLPSVPHGQARMQGQWCSSIFPPPSEWVQIPPCPQAPISEARYKYRGSTTPVFFDKWSGLPWGRQWRVVVTDTSPPGFDSRQTYLGGRMLCAPYLKRIALPPFDKFRDDKSSGTGSLSSPCAVRVL